jgi:PAS domain S-box-containing protein
MGNDIMHTQKSDGSHPLKMPSDRELLMTLLDNIPDSIYFKDIHSRFIKANKAWKAKSNKKSSVEGKTDFDFFTHEHAQQAFEDEQRIIKTGEPIVGIEEKETWPDKPDSWVSTTKMPLRDSNDCIIGTFGLSRDITDVKKIGFALQKAKDELEERVKERTAELTEAKVLLEQNLEQLKFLNITAFKMAQILDIEEMFNAIGEAFLARFPESQLSICQKSKSGFTCVYAIGLLDTSDARRLSEQTMASFLNQGVEITYLESWPDSSRLQFDWPHELEKYPCWIALPLQADNTTLAVVQIFAPSNMKATFQKEKTLLSTLAAHAAACLSNAIHYKYLEVKARMEGELEAARNIQQSLTPQETPLIPRVSIAGIYQPAHEVGGDYLDYFQCGDGSWVVIIADVCGKGVPAALLMVVLRSIARVESRSHFSARSLLCAVNQSMMLNINERSFITALCLVIKADGSSMTYARSGHPKLLKMGADGVVSTINSNGIALGMMADPAGYVSIIQEVFIPLVAGDTYLAYTDGLSEATDSTMTAFDQTYISKSMHRGKDYPVGDLVAGILDDVKEFSSGKPAHDDLTLFALKVTG